MKQLETVGPRERNDTPRYPIVALGKQTNYLFVGAKIEQVIEEIKQATEEAEVHSAVGNSDHEEAKESEKYRLRLDSFDFFDSTGQPLDLIVTAGQPMGLVVKDLPREDVFGRIKNLFQEVELEIRRESCAPDNVPLIRLLREIETISPDEFISKLADEANEVEEVAVPEVAQMAARTLFKKKSCSWWNRICGRC